MTMVVQDKRKRPETDGTIDEEGKGNKRHKSVLVSVMASQPQQESSKREAPPKFQRYHLIILQSLYESDAEEEEEGDKYYQSGDKSSSHQGSPPSNQAKSKRAAALTVDDKLWKQTKRFLREREKLMRQKKEASRLKDVHQEALKYMAEGEFMDFRATSPRSVSTAERNGQKVPLLAQSSVGHKYNNSVGVARSAASPVHTLNFFSPQKTLSAATSNSDTKAPFRCFGLVANLLEKKAQAFEGSARYCSNPYGSVLNDIEANIKKLENHLHCLQEKNNADSKQAVEDLLSRPVLSSASSFSWQSIHHQRDAGLRGAKGAISKLGTKLSLWRMLVSDMKSVTE